MMASTAANAPEMAVKSLDDLSPLQVARISYRPQVPDVLLTSAAALQVDASAESIGNPAKVAHLFPKTSDQKFLRLVSSAAPAPSAPLNVGVLFSGGQAPGGHNVAIGLLDYLTEFHPGSTVYGIRSGPAGLIKGEAMVLTEDNVRAYRNSGGFDMLGSSRTKVEKPEDFEAVVATVRKFDLGALVIIGGDDSNTNAAHLAEYFAQRGDRLRVIGVPKTIDGDLKCGAQVPMSFGFDSATKLYSELIGNVMVDARSAHKYYHFIRLMGRSASHITLECALQTCPNWAWIGEEVQAERMSLAQIAGRTADIVAQRSARGMNYGVFLIPEGLIEFVPEVGALIGELNSLLGDSDKSVSDARDVIDRLSPVNRSVLESIPLSVREQLLMDRDPHGNVQVAKIETERLLSLMVEEELRLRQSQGTFSGAFNYVTHYFGYEGRCCLPSNADANYCYALGRGAAALAVRGATGVMVSISDLHKPAQEWLVGGAPLVSLMTIELRKGKPAAVIEKALVKLEGPVMAALAARRSSWRLEDHYRSPGPTQLYGPLADDVNLTLKIEHGGFVYAPSRR